MAVVIKRFDVFLVALDPTIGSEMQKARPCVVVSPDEINRNLRTVIIAPMTTVFRDTYPVRVPCQFQGKDGQIALDQIRVVDKSRLIKHLGELSADEQKAVLETLKEMFSE
jgi:mRNA interferase MazF